MNTTTYSELRKNLATYWDQALAGQPVQITRQGGHGDIVLMSEADYCSLVETARLLGSPANAARLVSAMVSLAEQAKGGR